jgi:hypothetical protein
VAPSRIARRALLAGGVGVVALGCLAGGGYELIEHGVVPGKERLDEALGRTMVEEPDVHYRTPGPTVSGSFSSVGRLDDQLSTGWSAG